MQQDFVGIGEASRMLGLSRTSLQKLVDAGRIPAVKTAGGHRRLSRTAVEAVHHEAGLTAMLGVTDPVAVRASAVAAEQADVMTVVVVEDDAATAALMSSLFAEYYPGVNFLLASDGLDAVVLLERNRPQILITDLNMTPFDGFRLLALVSDRREYESVALVVMSSMSDQEIAQRGGLAPDVLFMRKPLDLPRLRGFVDAHVQWWSAQALRALPAATV
ncbi:MAG: hypothetical protein B7X59_10110 [Polaromonas sp. 39-63-203]|uniref:response regulator n=1 Tax=Polaromonas sp. TaxID=1869339 RepID=UPI000BC73D58|nr:response regulator [Polaromonas sp.]OZA96273.1 MAG: hypothetical protein B7X59_10110 [Polaromonas sp. 39-63-203]HQS31122.1 response regulator [Polaromonas sp.]HQS90724.1 response regulator [Polaromonas sp.]